MSIQSKLGRFDLTMIIVSLVIGVGIFRNPSSVADKAGTPLVFYSAWILGGIICICGAFTFAEIGSRLPAVGGYYRIFSHCYHPVFAFMFNWALIFTNAGSAVTVALVGAQYIQPVIVPPDMVNIFTPRVIGIIVLSTLFVVNYLGIKMGARAQNVLSVLKIILLLVLCLPLFAGKTMAVNSTPIAPQSIVDGLKALGVSLIFIFFTYGGYQNTINLGGDVKEPRKNIPLGIAGGMAIVLALYLLINIAYCQVLGFNNMKNQPLIASQLAKTFFGDAGFKLTSITVFISVLGFINSSFIYNPRMWYAMAEDDILPPIFKKINEKTQAQEFAVTCYFLIMLVTILLSDTFEKIVNYVIFVDSSSLAFAAFTIFILRRRMKGEDYDGFKMKLFPFIPILYIIVLTVVCVSDAGANPKEVLVSLGVLLAGYPLYYALKLRKAK
jgi:APA family basic amino acid/polyamine antiporter